MMIFIGMDDTDNLQSRGTGRLSRAVADELACDFKILGVVRHQLLVDPRVPYTSHNSCAVIVMDGPAETDLPALFERVKAQMLADFQPGSDPGLCVTAHVPLEVTAFGHKAQSELVTQADARELAARNEILLEGLGGTQDGVIGSLAGVGLAAEGNDGRYLQVGNIRDLTGLQTVETILNCGVSAIQTVDGQPVTEGFVLADKIRPARRNGQPVALVNWDVDHWLPIKPEH
jgi:tRNA(Ile2) C34 agmatinyltransferase TiaS